MKLKLQVVLIPVSLAELPTSEVSLYKKFLHLTDPQCSVKEVCDALVQRYYKLYPDAEPLQIEGIQDNDRCDLDPDFAAEDIFTSGDLLRVLVNNVLPAYSREASTILPDSIADNVSMRKRGSEYTLEHEDSRFSKRSRTIWGVQRDNDSVTPPQANRTVLALSDQSGLHFDAAKSTSPVSLPPPVQENSAYPVIPYKKSSPSVANKGKRITSGMLQVPPAERTNSKHIFSEDESEVSRMTTDFRDQVREAPASSEPEEIENGTGSDDLISNRLLKFSRRGDNLANSAIKMAPPPASVGLTPSKATIKAASETQPAPKSFVTLTPYDTHSPSRADFLSKNSARPITSLTNGLGKPDAQAGKDQHSQASSPPANGGLQEGQQYPHLEPPTDSVYQPPPLSVYAAPASASVSTPLHVPSSQSVKGVLQEIVPQAKASNGLPASAIPEAHTIDSQVQLKVLYIPSRVLKVQNSLKSNVLLTQKTSVNLSLQTQSASLTSSIVQPKSAPQDVAQSTAQVATSAEARNAKANVNVNSLVVSSQRRETSPSGETPRDTAASATSQGISNLSKEEILGIFKHGLRIPNKINKKLAVSTPDPTPFLVAEADLKRQIRAQHNIEQNAQELDNRRRAAVAPTNTRERSLRSRVTIGGVPNFDTNLEMVVDEKEKEKEKRASELPAPFNDFTSKSKLSSIYVKMKKLDARIDKKNLEKAPLMKIKSEPSTPKVASTKTKSPLAIASIPNLSQSLNQAANAPEGDVGVVEEGSSSDGDEEEEEDLEVGENNEHSDEDEDFDRSHLAAGENSNLADVESEPEAEPQPELESEAEEAGEEGEATLGRRNFSRKQSGRAAFKRRLAKQFEEADIILLDSTDSEEEASESSSESSELPEAAKPTEKADSFRESIAVDTSESPAPGPSVTLTPVPKSKPAPASVEAPKRHSESSTSPSKRVKDYPKSTLSTVVALQKLGTIQNQADRQKNTMDKVDKVASPKNIEDMKSVETRKQVKPLEKIETPKQAEIPKRVEDSKSTSKPAANILKNSPTDNFKSQKVEYAQQKVEQANPEPKDSSERKEIGPSKSDSQKINEIEEISSDSNADNISNKSKITEAAEDTATGVATPTKEETDATKKSRADSKTPDRGSSTISKFKELISSFKPSANSPADNLQTSAKADEASSPKKKENESKEEVKSANSATRSKESKSDPKVHAVESSDDSSSSSSESSSSGSSSSSDSDSNSSSDESEDDEKKASQKAEPKKMINLASSRLLPKRLNSLTSRPLVKSVPLQQPPSQTYHKEGVRTVSILTPFSKSSSDEDDKMKSKSPEKKPTPPSRLLLNSLTDLAERGVPEVREDGGKSNRVGAIAKPEIKPISSDSDSDSDSSSSSSSSSDSDLDDSSSDEESARFVSVKKLATDRNGKSKKKKNGGFSSLMRDAKKR